MGRSRSKERPKGRSRSPPGFQERFAKFVEDCDGRGLHALLQGTERTPIGAKSATAPSDDVAAEIIRAERAGPCEEGLEALCSALKLWVARYLTPGARGGWMLLPLLWLASRPRRLAADLDRKGRTEKHQKKLVETMRDHFQRLHRDKSRREGALVVCCELLRLYFRLEQASQCSPILKKLSHGQSGESLDLAALPKALAVTLCFLWGKHCVLDGDVMAAEEKLSWALAHCPPSAAANRRRILTYLVPCRLRIGQLPSRGLLSRHGLDYFRGLVKAVADGNVALFKTEFEERKAQYIKMGTYLVIAKLKAFAYWNLCRQVHSLAMQVPPEPGTKDIRHKQDLAYFERAFEWQDSCDEDETLCLLAHLIHMGAARAFISDEYRKIVFSKDKPFPDAAKWCLGV